MRYKSVLTFFIITIALGIPSIYLHFLTTSSPSRGIEDIYVKTSNHWSSFQKKPSGTLQAEVGNTTWTSSTCATPSAIPDWCPPSSRRTLYIAPSAGLGNVLQTIASALTVAKRKKFNVKLVLQSRTFGSTSWGELFLEPALSEINGTFPDGSGLPKMTKACIVQDHFVEWKDIKIKWKNTGHQDVLCASTCCWKEPPFPHSVLWFYKSLVPAQAIQRSIQEFQEQLRWHNFQWVGVHVRRSDNLRLVKKLVHIEKTHQTQTIDDKDLLPIESYIFLMKNVAKGMPKRPGAHRNVRPLRYFLASDNKDVRDTVVSSFPADAVVEFPKDQISDLRGSTAGLQSGVIDMFLLAACEVLIGTPYSTFSTTANYIGGQLYWEPELANMN